MPILLFNELVSSCWTLLCAFQISAFHFSSLNTFDRFNILWNELEKSTNAAGHAALKRRVWICTFVGWFLVIGDLIMFVGMNSLTDTSDTTLLFVTQENRYFIVMHMFVMVASVWLSGSWIFPLLTNLVISNYLRHKYTVLNLDLRHAMIHSQQDNSFLDIQRYRTKHEQITKLVQCADQVLQMQMATLIINDIAVVCLIMYVIIWYRSLDAMYLFTIIFWLGYALIALFKVTYNAYRVNSEVCHYLS